MFSLIVIIFQLISLIFIGSFARTDSLSSTNLPYIPTCLALLLGFTLMYSPYRRLSLSTLLTLLLTLSVAIQTSILFITFWESCFLSFSNSFALTSNLLLKSISASLAVLLTCLDFIGLFPYWQLYFIVAPIMAIGYSLCEAILTKGLNVYDGGGGILIFLYSGICSILIWLIAVRGRMPINMYRLKESYLAYTLSFIGVAVAFITWPIFNAAGALTTYPNTSITSVTTLMLSAESNTYLALSTALITSVLLSSKDSKEQGMKPRLYIDCFINGGIIIASYSDLALNPVVGMVMVMLSTIITLVLNRYFLTSSDSQAEVSFKFLMVNYSKVLYRIVWGFMGICICSIVIVTRDSSSSTGNILLLNSSYSNRAGLEIVGFIIVTILAILFGGISGAAVYAFLNSKEGLPTETELMDEALFYDLQEQIHPLHHNEGKTIAPLDVGEYTSRLIKQSLLRSKEVPLKVMSGSKVDFQTKPEIQINKDFSRTGLMSVNVSQMVKVIEESENREEEGVVGMSRPLQIQQSSINIVQDVPNVQRRLEYSDQGSSIEEEQTHKPPIRQ